MEELTGAIICAVFALACFIISVMQFKEKGFLFNNAYSWASKQEREKMDKKPYYRQSGIVFALCGAIFLSMALACILLTNWLWIVTGALTAAVLTYAVASSIKERNE